MDLKPLGKTGMHVSRLCLGAMMFGERGNPDHDDCVRIIDAALDAGINFIDTADAYSAGESEEIVGKAIANKRDELIVATKFFFPATGLPNDRGGSRRWIVKEVENSLRRLGTDYIDLYQIHRWDPNTDIEETLWAFTDLVSQGKIRAFGSSMFPADRIVESHWVSENRNLMRFRCEQPWYSIFARDIERFVLPACERYGMGVITWSPLDGGFLSGKYRTAGDLVPGTRAERSAQIRGQEFDPESEFFARKLALVGKLDELATGADITLAQLAVAFTLVHPAVTSSIIGPRTMEHLETILPAADVELSEDMLDAIDDLVPPGTSLNGINDVPSGLSRHTRRPAR